MKSLLRIALAVTIAASTITVVTPSEAAAQTSAQEAVTRLAGADRYATAAAISAATFDKGVDAVYIATGLDFPDAVSAGAAAAHLGGPLLLVKKDVIPTATSRELNRLKPKQIIVVGGEAVIYTDVEAELGDYAPIVTRHAGTDRYNTSASISSVFESPVDVAFIATGQDFPDALVAGVAAGMEGGPVMLVTNTVIPTAVRRELERLKPARIVIAGGESAVGPDVAKQLEKLTSGTVTRLSGPNRYVTAEEISAATFNTINDTTAMIATGANYADGLTAVPAAVKRGVPLLLVPPDQLLSPAKREVQRLRPRSATILGGEGAVAATVTEELTEALTESGGFEPPFTWGPYLLPAPNAAVPLVAEVEFTTSVPVDVRVLIEAGGKKIDEQTFDNDATEHKVPILGLKPGVTTTVTVTVIDAGGKETTTQTKLKPVGPELPSDFPSFAVTVNKTSAEPGVTMFDVPARQPAPGGFLVITDASGDVLWYYRSDVRIQDARRTSDGTLLFNDTDKRSIIEMDMLGTVLNRWEATGLSTAGEGAIGVATDSFHHEIDRLDDGTYLTLSSEVRMIDGYPTSETDLTPRTTPTTVVGDLVTVFAADGSIVAEWALLDMIDPTRIAYDSFGSFWDSFYTAEAPTADWSHANGVVHDPSDDTFIVSLRHQDAMVKFNRAGELVWILGPHENWKNPYDSYLLTPVGPDFQWLYHPHAPMITSDGNLLLYDNSVHRASPPDPKITPTTSRAVQYRINQTTMTVTQVWEYDPGNAYTAVLGDADEMPTTGNVLVTFGALTPLSEGAPSARLVEVTSDAVPVVVWTLEVLDDNPSGNATRPVYRSERLPTLYP